MLYTRDDAEWHARRAVSAVTVAGWFVAAAAVAGLLWELTSVADLGGWVGLVLGLVNIAAALAFLVSGFYWVQWFKEVYATVDERGRARHQVFTAVWAWVVPGVALLLPKRMVNDVWRIGLPRNARPSPPAVVQAWWACWFVYSGSDLVRLWRDDLGEGVRDAIAIGRQALLAVTAVLAVRTIRVLTARVTEPAGPRPSVDAYAG